MALRFIGDSGVERLTYCYIGQAGGATVASEATKGRLACRGCVRDMLVGWRRAPSFGFGHGYPPSREVRLRPMRSVVCCLPLFAVLGGAVPRSELEPIAYHDNAVAAGADRDGVREVRVEIRRGLWRPNGSDRPGTPMMAFAEPGMPLRLPGPLIRVAAGTKLSITAS